jgi:hypothetical protein
MGMDGRWLPEAWDVKLRQVHVRLVSIMWLFGWCESRLSIFSSIVFVCECTLMIGKMIDQ